MTTRLMDERLFRLDPPTLLGSRCSTCATTHFPPRPACPDCGATIVESAALPDTGVIETYTVVRAAPSIHPQPYVIAWVALDDSQLQVFARVVDVDPDRVAVGDPVALDVCPVRIDDDGVEVHSYCWRPAWTEEAA